MVAENIAVCRRGPMAAAIDFTAPMKPMSSMRSASSSTSQRVSLRRSLRSSTRSLRRPGVAMTTSTPLAIFWICASAKRRRGRARSTAALPASLCSTSSICTASSRVGARISARVVIGDGRPVSSAMPARIGRPKAAVLPEPVWAMPMMSRPRAAGRWPWPGWAWGCGTRPWSARNDVRRKTEFGEGFGQVKSHVWPRASQSAQQACPRFPQAVHRSNGDRDCRGCDCRPGIVSRVTSPLTALAG
jgi:hypothetical protein